jgi:hypothetical protein
MEALTVAEAIELIRINEEAMATQFQTWLTITFASIVAVFAGRKLLNNLMRWLITLLYLLASLSVAAMSIYLAESNAQLTVVLASRGVTLAAPIFAGSVFFALFLAGVGTTVYFIHMKPDKASA